MEQVAESDPVAGPSPAPAYHAIIDRRQVDFAHQEPERVDLRAPHEKAFRTFKTDRIFPC